MIDVPQSLTLRTIEAHDADRVLAIYEEGMQTGHATFADTVPTFSAWRDSHIDGTEIIASLDGDAVGWAALSPVSSRCVYAGVAEVSVYVSEAARGRGVGRALLSDLISRSEALGIWTLQAGIFPENIGSLGLHQDLGFKVLGVRERLGRMTYGPMRGVWRDVILLERRSAVAGID
ncbi:MAG: N-acetyltransferase family protein [Pseudomonadota bacterium]